MYKQKAFMAAIIIVGLSFLLQSCSIAAREGTTSPCYAQKHFSGYGPGGFGKHRPKN